MDLLDTRRGNINLEQSCEINSLLGVEAIKGSKSMLYFESDTKDIKELLASPDFNSKIDGLEEL